MISITASFFMVYALGVGTGLLCAWVFSLMARRVIKQSEEEG